jgi:hypothetical protein
MKKIIGITTFLLFAVISVAYLYFSKLNTRSRNNDLVLSEIPADASIIFQYPNDRSLYEIFKDYRLFDTIIGNQSKDEIHWLKDILLSDKELEMFTEGQKVFVSVHPSAGDSIDFLWSLPLKEPVSNDELPELLNKSGSGIKVIKSGPILSINAPNIRRTFYLSIDKGIARGSFSKSLLGICIDGEAKKIEKSFVREISEGVKSNENALANLFINYRKPGLLTPFLRQNQIGNFELFRSFSGYSGLTLNYKSDALMFNGITSGTEGQKSYIDLYLHQKPIKNTLKRIFPYNTANSVTYGVSDYTLFHKDLQELFSRRKSTDSLKKEIDLIISESGLNPDRDIKKLWGDEMSILQLSTHESLAIIKTTDGSKLQFFLEPVSSEYSGLIRKVNYPELFYYYWGDPLKRFHKPFFVISDNLIIISNSANTLKKYLDDYNSERFLFKTTSFTQFDQLVADQANISFVFNLKNSDSIIRSIFKKSYANNFSSPSYGIKDLYAVSFQLSGNKDHFFTNFYTGYKNNIPAEELSFNVDSIKTDD